MSRPRPVYKNKTSMVTKRVHKRQLLLDADPMVAQIVKYNLAYCANKYNIDLHAVVTEGNHIHEVATDNEAKLPDFYRDFHSFTARQLNKYYEERDSFWSSSQTNTVANETPDDGVHRIVYTFGNPVADGIERHGADHKGVRLRWPREPEVIERPPYVFKSPADGGKLPDRVVLEFKRPPGFDGLSDEELDRIIEARILAYEKEKREERDAEGLPWLCDQPNRTPNPRAFPKSKPTLFRLAPLIGARIEKHRKYAIARLKQFRTDHDAAMEKLRQRETDVVFPHGTFLAARRWNVAVAPAPS